jgi:glycosyltransferase involved in cell wall biosynthesis
MKLLWIIHGYVPKLNAGAENYTHNLNKYLNSQGHQIKVLIPKEYAGLKNESGEFEGINIVITEEEEERRKLVEWCDIVLTHLDFASITVNYIQNNRPIVYVAHNTFFHAYDYLKDKKNVFIIYNSLYASQITPFENEYAVLRPPITAKRTVMNPEKNKYITLINMNENKGGNVLKLLAERMPQYKFMGVKGSYGEQVEQPRCVKIHKNTADINEVYEQTRLIIMPSAYESWGMVASEACINGIPVIASEAFGLKENLDYAGTIISGDLIKWKKAIELYDNQAIYKQKSEQALKRAEELIKMNEKELNDVNMFLNKIYYKFLMRELK